MTANSTGVSTGHHTRDNSSLTASIESRVLVWLARRMPVWVSSDQLTVLGLVAMLFAGLCFWAGHWLPHAPFGVVLCLALNWLGDSLDGTLARVRDRQRPRYGFYVDHVVDVFGAAFLLTGVALSPYMSVMIGLSLLLVYLMLSAEIYLATHAVGIFRISYWKFGGTELRILLAVGTIYVLYRPELSLGGRSYLFFDVAGVIGIASLVVTLVVSVIRNTRTLYVAEPLSK